MKKIGNLDAKYGALIPYEVNQEITFPKIWFDGEEYEWVYTRTTFHPSEDDEYPEIIECVYWAYYKSASEKYIGVRPCELDDEYGVYEAYSTSNISGQMIVDIKFYD